MTRLDARGEEGIALTVAICSLALMITLGGVALNQAVSALRTSGEQTHVKRALQAADAALDSAAYAASRADIGSSLDINALDPTSVITQNCVVNVAGAEPGVLDLDAVPLDPLTAVDAQGRKWCPAAGDETVAANSSFSYRLSQLVRAGAGPCGATSAVTLDREAVGVGRSGTTVRRVKANLQANVALLSGAAVQSSSKTAPLAMSNSARILGDARSNQNITGGVTNVVSGNATPGDGFTASPTMTIAGSREDACEDFAIPNVAQGDAPTINDNLGIAEDRCVAVATNLPVACTVPIVGTRTGDVDYNPATRKLEVWGNGRALLTGSVYSFCSVVLRGNGVLQVDRSNPVVRIFLDDPGNCRDTGGNLLPSAGTITMSEQARIVNCHLQTAPETLQIYAVGNPDAALPTTQTFAGTGLLTTALRGTLCGVSLGAILGEPMTIIAPHSLVQLAGSTATSGQVAARQVTMAGTSSVNPVNALVNLNRLGGRPVLPLYEATDYVECTGRDFGALPPAEPAQGC